MAVVALATLTSSGNTQSKFLDTDWPRAVLLKFYGKTSCIFMSKTREHGQKMENLKTNSKYKYLHECECN